LTTEQGWAIRLAALVVGAVVLWLLNVWLDPVPVAAGPAFVLAGCLVFWKGWPGLGRTAITAGLGALTGVLLHASWHWRGQSPSPEEGFWVHLLWEGVLGFCAAMLALLPLWITSRGTQASR
jgi:hypothetical protein